MLKPDPVIYQHQHTTQYEQRISELDNRKMPQVARIDGMRCDAQSRQGEREVVYEPEEHLCADDGVDEVAEETRREDGVLLDEFREVVEPGGYGEGEEAEAKDDT